MTIFSTRELLFIFWWKKYEYLLYCSFNFIVGLETSKTKKENFKNFKKTPLAIQWLKLPAPNAGCAASIPGQWTKILHAMRCSQKFSSVQLLGRVQLFTTPKLQHARLPCSSPTLGAYSNWCPSSRWAIQPFHPLSTPSPPAFNLSQQQCLFQGVSSHRLAKVLVFQLEHQSFQWIFRTDFL